MKRILILSFCLCLPFVQAISGTPKWVKVANKSVVQLFAAQQGGDTLRANAFFVDQAGALLAPLKTIQNARSAWVVDASGKRFEISRIQGFNATYNVVRLQAETGKKRTVCLPTADQALTKSQVVYIAPSATSETIREVEKADTYNYYTLSAPARTEWAGLPIVNEAGQVAAILQTPVTINKAPNYALDVRMGLSLTVKAIEANSSELRNYLIPLLLPADEEQALSFLYLASATASALRTQYAEDFVQRFPKNASGYIQKADLQCAEQQYDAAWQTYEEALTQKTQKDDELLHARSRAIYNATLQPGASLPQQWTLDQALTDVKAAIAIAPQPLYALHEANILFAQKRFQEAYSGYIELTKSNMRSAEIFMYAWQCQQNLGASDSVLLALNDSALACLAKPYNAQAAPYLLLRGNTLARMGRLRDAIAALNDYEHLMAGQQLTAAFYYQREQLETRARLFSPALNDIHRAIFLAPTEPVYHAELAALLYRLNEVDSAIEECNKAIGLDPNFPDAHRLLGVCLREKGRLAEARQQLQKAVDLGDTLAKTILEKLKVEES